MLLNAPLIRLRHLLPPQKPAGGEGLSIESSESCDEENGERFRETRATKGSRLRVVNLATRKLARGSARPRNYRFLHTNTSFTVLPSTHGSNSRTSIGLRPASVSAATMSARS
jgi:hypothetical protein